MRAKIGDLAIAQFDGYENPKPYNEQLCIIVGHDNRWREFQFFYWEKGKGSRTIIHHDDLPHNRLRVVMPKRGKRLVTNVCDLTVNDVVNVTHR